MQDRYFQIDFLRGISIVGVVIIHVLSYSLTTAFYIFTWNYLHFVIAAFIFCSGYVMMARYKSGFDSIGHVLKWYKKRLTRLLVPYYIYLLVHYMLLILLPMYFGGSGLKLEADYIASSIFLSGGIDLNWLTLLFVQLTLLFPVLVHLTPLKKSYYMYAGGAFIIALIFTFYRFPYDQYRSVMWIPWSFILILSMQFYFLHSKGLKTKTYLKMMAVSGAIFAVLYLLGKQLHWSDRIIDHKYPPDLYDLSFESTITLAVLALSNWNPLHVPVIKRAYTFLSQESYHIFFIHYILIDLVQHIKTTYPVFVHVPVQLIFVLTLSIVIAYMLRKLLETINVKLT